MQKNSKFKEHVEQMDKDLEQRRVKKDHSAGVTPDLFIKTEFIPQPLMFLLDNVFSMYDEVVLKQLQNEEMKEMVQFHWAIVEYIQLLDKSYHQYKKWTGKPKTDKDQDLMDAYSNCLMRRKSQFSDLYNKCGLDDSIQLYRSTKQQNVSLQPADSQFDRQMISCIMCTKHKGLHYFESACRYSNSRKKETKLH